MAEPARRARQEVPPLDPTAIERAYRHERAKRRAKVERIHARRVARIRFIFVLVILLGLAILLGATAWQQIQNLFGL